MSPVIQALPREVGAPYLSPRVVPVPTVLIVADRAAHCTRLAATEDDVRTAIAQGEAMDLAHGAVFYPAATIRHVTLDEMRATDAVVIAGETAGL